MTALQPVCEISQTNDSVANCVWDLSNKRQRCKLCGDVSNKWQRYKLCGDLSNKRQRCNLCVRSLKQTTGLQPVCEISQTNDSVATCVWDLSNNWQRRKLCVRSLKQTTASQTVCEISQTNDSVANCVEISQINDSVITVPCLPNKQQRYKTAVDSWVRVIAP